MTTSHTPQTSLEMVLDACATKRIDAAGERAMKVCGAADDLLAALKASVAPFEGDSIPEIEVEYGLRTAQRIDMCRAAIKKATA